MNYKKYLNQIKQQKPIPQNIIKQICKKIQQIFIQQSNLLQITTPICIVGDVHGQFYDVLQLFKLGGQVPNTKYIFLGDYVDRGYNSLETILYLFVLKILYPQHIYLTRGNHQSRTISIQYGFYEQIFKKYGHNQVWKLFSDIFDYLPIAAVISDQIFCVHGGLSPDIYALDQILQINRVMQIPVKGAFADLLWSDPQNISQWNRNQRGAGYIFGHQVVNQFNYHNNLKLIARSHQLALQGYFQWFKKNDNNQPQLITVWSAPNYCYRSGNLASIMKVDQHANYSYIIFQQNQRSQASPQEYKKVIPYFL